MSSVLLTLVNNKWEKLGIHSFNQNNCVRNQAKQRDRTKTGQSGATKLELETLSSYLYYIYIVL